MFLINLITIPGNHWLFGAGPTEAHHASTDSSQSSGISIVRDCTQYCVNKPENYETLPNLAFTGQQGHYFPYP